MRQKMSQWTGNNVSDDHSRDMHFMSNCINRRSQLETILYTYNNLHKLHPRFRDLAETAFNSDDPLLLWNFENETLLNSPDVEMLMNQHNQIPHFPIEQHYSMQPTGQVHYNLPSLVSRLDASHQQVQQPTPSFTWNAPNQRTNIPQYLGPHQGLPPQMAPVPFNPRVPPPQVMSPQMFMQHPPMLRPSSQMAVLPQQMMGHPLPVQTTVPLPQQYLPPQQMISQGPVPSELGPACCSQIASPMQYPPPSQHVNYQNVVYDSSGNAFQQLVVTQNVLVPVGTGQTSSSSGCSTYSRCSEISEEYQSSYSSEDVEGRFSTSQTPKVVEIDENNIQCEDVEEEEYETDEEEYEDSFDKSQHGDPQSDESHYSEDDSRPDEEDHDNSEPGADQTEETSPVDMTSHTFEYTAPERTLNVDEADAVTSSLSSESSRSESMSSMEAPEPVADIPVVYTPVITKKVDDDEWKVVSNKKRGPSLIQPMPEKCRVVHKQMPVVQKIVEKSETSTKSDAPADKPPGSENPPKLTKKEKRLLAAARAKELETDDAVLEAALREKQQIVASYEKKAEPIVCAPNPIPDRENKQRNENENKAAIVTSVTVSPLNIQKLPPRILHSVRTSIQRRVTQLTVEGRVLTNEDPLQQQYAEKIVDFEANHKGFDGDEVPNMAKQFIKRRIEVFQARNNVLCFSWITIYEVLLTDLPRALLPDLMFLRSLYEEHDLEFETYEMTFINFF